MQHRLLALALASAGLLSACGGGSDGSGETPAPPPSGGTPTPVTLVGVVAKGAALGGAAVTATCATGGGSATTDAAGAYSLSLGTSGALPCVLSAASSDGTTHLHSVATTSTANITPLTELLVAQLTGEDPATFAAGATGSALSSTITTSAVAAAQNVVVSTLTSAGVDTSAITDFVTGTLVAASGSTSGNSYDQALEALNTQLTTAGTTLSELTTTVATTSAAASGSSSSGSSGNSSLLPPELLLATKASNCSTLATGNYRVIELAPSVTTGDTDPVTATAVLHIDAATLTVNNAATPNDTWTWTAAGNCHYTAPDGSDIVVAPSGVIVARAYVDTDDDSVNTSARGSFRMVIGLPEQQHTPSELEGSWNGLFAWMNAGHYSSSAISVSIDANGAVTHVLCANDEETGTPTASCTTSTTDLPVFSANAEGGFDLASTSTSDVWKDRVFAFRSGSGDLMLLDISPDGSWFVMSRGRTLSLPALNSTSANWSLLTDTTGVGLALSGSTHVVTAVDASTGTYTRDTTDQASSSVTTQTLAINAPRDGYTHRLASSGVRESWFMGLKGMGLTGLYLVNSSTSGTSNARFGLSVQQP